ncbi:MAG: hypothetical protein WB822_11405, partial [Rhodoplanes sp.]
LSAPCRFPRRLFFAVRCSALRRDERSQTAAGHCPYRMPLASLKRATAKVADYAQSLLANEVDPHQSSCRIAQQNIRIAYPMCIIAEQR